MGGHLLAGGEGSLESGEVVVGVEVRAGAVVGEVTVYG
jgi:hypothetical protein